MVGTVTTQELKGTVTEMATKMYARGVSEEDTTAILQTAFDSIDAINGWSKRANYTTLCNALNTLAQNISTAIDAATPVEAIAQYVSSLDQPVLAEVVQRNAPPVAVATEEYNVSLVEPLAVLVTQHAEKAGHIALLGPAREGATFVSRHLQPHKEAHQKLATVLAEVLNERGVAVQSRSHGYSLER